MIIAAVGLCGCGRSSIHHGSVSRSTLNQLQSQAVTPDQAQSMLRRGHIATGSLTPAGRLMRLPMHKDRAGMPHLEVSLNGNSAEKLLFDTGATVSVFDANMAIDQDISTVPGVKPQMLGVMGSEAGMGGILASMSIGPWQLTHVPCVVRLQRSSSRMGLLGQNYDISVLGFNLARKYCSFLTLDYPRGYVDFGFGDTFRGATSRHVARSPLQYIHGVPAARVTAGKVSWDAVVDSGSSFGVEIDQALAKKLGHATGGQAVVGNYVMVGVGGAVTPQQAGVRILNLPQLRMLGSTFKNAQVDVMPGPARIGSYFLKDYRITFDFRRQLIWLEW